eukprot:TRINITY_DN24268_c0_g2_i2.p1 TRINITY_DN24268_c0_g2~~TRINITY_DN24268_c0_g2_i2.p1  ORF type:complete len:158 (+),score=38.37 TRINITY_DN24268_c0_g2_i2:203-676(+)
MGARRIGRSHHEELKQRVEHLEQTLMAAVFNWQIAESSAMLLHSDMRSLSQKLQEENDMFKTQVDRLIAPVIAKNMLAQFTGKWELLDLGAERNPQASQDAPTDEGDVGVECDEEFMEGKTKFWRSGTTGEVKTSNENGMDLHVEEAVKGVGHESSE